MTSAPASNSWFVVCIFLECDAYLCQKPIRKWTAMAVMNAKPLQHTDVVNGKLRWKREQNVAAQYCSYRWVHRQPSQRSTNLQSNFHVFLFNFITLPAISFVQFHTHTQARTHAHIYIFCCEVIRHELSQSYGTTNTPSQFPLDTETKRIFRQQQTKIQFEGLMM